MKDVANIFLVLTMACQFYTHYALGDSFERMAPSLIFGLLLFCRLIILFQVVKKEKKDLELMKELMEQEQMDQASDDALPAEELKEESEPKKTI